MQEFKLRESPRRPVPIYISALNPKMIRLGGECADGVIFNLLPVSFVDEAAAHVAEGARAAGRDPRGVRIATLMLAAAGQDPDAMDALRRAATFYVASPTYHYMLTAAGYGDLVKRVTAAWDRRQFAAATALVTDDFLRRVTVFGDRAAIRARLGEYLSRGVYPIIYPAPRDAHLFDDTLRVIRDVAAAMQAG